MPATVGEYIHSLLDRVDWLEEQIRLLNEDNKTMKSEMKRVAAAVSRKEKSAHA